jgi:excisionase family DNA binding protein
LLFQQTASWNEDTTMNHNPDDLLTPSDAARVLGLSADSVRVLSDNGRLPSMRTVSGRRLFRRSDVDRLAIQRAQTLTGAHSGHGGATAAYPED